jgi:hypothetical protein
MKFKSTNSIQYQHSSLLIIISCRTIIIHRLQEGGKDLYPEVYCSSFKPKEPCHLVWAMADSTPQTSRESYPFPAFGKENEPQASVSKAVGSASAAKTPSAKTPSAKTPSKHRLSLGTPANFYFKYVNSSKKAAAMSTSFLDESSQNEGNLTGTISIPGLNKSVNLADTSLLSIGASSSDSSDQSDGDMLNKSTLSDTTDLTASSFVLQATSRQVMRQLAVEAQSAKKKKAPPLTIDAEAEAAPVETKIQDPGSASKAASSSSQITVPLAQHTPTEGTSASRRQSLRGASPSLRQRMSATPQSLQKLTEDLRNQRINRQAKQDSMRRLSVDSKNSIQSLNAQLESLTSKNQNEGPDTTNLDRKRLPPAFAQPTPMATYIESVSAPSPALNISCTTQEIRGAMEEIFAAQQDEDFSSDTSDASKQDVAELETPHAVAEEVAKDSGMTNPTGIPTSIEVTKGLSPKETKESSSILVVEELKEQEEPESPTSPMTQRSAASGGRLTPGLTPTKLKSTPRRVLNPKVLDSPARNTRSSAKKSKRLSELDIIEEVGTSQHRRVSGVAPASLSEIASPTMLDFKTATGPGDLESVADEDDKVPMAEEEREGDTASLGDLASIVVGNGSAKGSPQVDTASVLTEQVSAELDGDDTVDDKEESSGDFSMAMDATSTADEISKENASSAEECLEQPTIEGDIPETSMAQEGEGDTASLADLTDILGSQTQTGGSVVDDKEESSGEFSMEMDAASSTSDTISKTNASSAEGFLEQPTIEGNNPETSVDQEGEGDTASLADLTDILGSQTQEGVSSVDDKEESPEESMDAASAFGEISKTNSFCVEGRLEQATMEEENPEVSVDQEGEGDTASLADLTDILGNPTHAEESSPEERSVSGSTGNVESPSLPTSTDESILKPTEEVEMTSPGGIQRANPISSPVFESKDFSVAASSPTQSEGDTVSIGGMSHVLRNSQRRTSTSSNTSKPGNMSRSTNSSPLSSVSKNLPTPEGPKAQQSWETVGSAKTPRDTSAIEAGGDTASLSDIADILGTGSIRNEANSPNSSYTKEDDNDSTHERIRTQFSQTPSSASANKRSQDSFGSAQRSQAGSDDGPETASLSDLAEILGTAPSQTQIDLEGTPASKMSSVGGASPSMSSNNVEVVNMSIEASPSVSASGSGGALVDGGSGEDSSDLFPSSSRKRSRSPSTADKPSELAMHSPVKPYEENSSTTKLTPTKSSSTHSPMRLTPNSHKKPTPTKIAPSPRRIPNPQHTNSPAKNTRSAKKATVQLEDEMEPNHLSISKRRLSEISNTENNRDGDVKVLLQKFDLDTDTTIGTSKRRKSSIQGLPPSARDKENSMLMSPMPRKSQPVGILSSRKKMRSAIKSSQRSVAFGSPEAAEYNIGSPSVSMTPMPSIRAKELYSIPRDNKVTGEASDTSSPAVEHTVEIEADLNVLVDKITIENMKGSPELSPISNARDDTGPVVLPGNYNVSKSKPEDDVLSMQSDSIDASTLGGTPREEMTIELETGMEGLIANMKFDPKHSPLSASCDKSLSSAIQDGVKGGPMEDKSVLSPAESSIEMTDAQSIASLNSAKSDKFTSKLQLNAQKLDFTLNVVETLGNLEGSDESMDVDEGDTVELENGMTGLLAAAGVRESIASTRNSSVQEKPWTPEPSLPNEKPQPTEAEGELEHAHESSDGRIGTSTIAFDDESSVASKRSRRSSIASRRFTLDSGDRLQISSDGSIRAPEYSFTEERSVSFKSPETSEIFPSMSLTQEPVTLTFEEILRSSGITRDDLRPKAHSDARDALVHFNNSAKHAKEPASERWNQFLQAVCGEVERRTEDDGAASETMSSIFASEPTRFMDLQSMLRSEDSENMQSLLNKLVATGRGEIEAEWNGWITTVMESFGGPLDEVFKDMGGTVGSLNELSMKCEQIQHQIASMNKRKVQKARRRSLARRKVSPNMFSDSRLSNIFLIFNNSFPACPSLPPPTWKTSFDL